MLQKYVKFKFFFFELKQQIFVITTQYVPVLYYYEIYFFLQHSEKKKREGEGKYIMSEEEGEKDIIMSVLCRGREISQKAAR